MKLQLIVEVTLIPAHQGHGAFCHEFFEDFYQADCAIGDGSRISGDGHSEKEAINQVVKTLQNRGLHGNLKIKRMGSK